MLQLRIRNCLQETCTVLILGVRTIRVGTGPREACMKFSSPKLAVLMLVLALCCTLVIPSATAQRLSDRDVEALLGNLKSDTKKFRSSFNSAVSKSTIRKTSQEKDAKALVERFQKQTESALDEFKDKKKLD